MEPNQPTFVGDEADAHLEVEKDEVNREIAHHHSLQA